MDNDYDASKDWLLRVGTERRLEILKKLKTKLEADGLTKMEIYRVLLQLVKRQPQVLLTRSTIADSHRFRSHEKDETAELEESSSTTNTADPAEERATTLCEKTEMPTIPELLDENVGNRITPVLAKLPRAPIMLHLNSHGAADARKNNPQIRSAPEIGMKEASVLPEKCAHKPDSSAAKIATKRPRIIDDLTCVEGTMFALTNSSETESSPAKKQKRHKIEEDRLPSLAQNAFEDKIQRSGIEALKAYRIRKKLRQFFGNTESPSEIEEENELMEESIPKRRRKKLRMSLDSGVSLGEISSEQVLASPDGEFFEKGAESIDTRLSAVQDELSSIVSPERSCKFDPLVRSMPLLDSQEKGEKAISENLPDSSTDSEAQSETNTESGKYRILITPIETTGVNNFAPMSLEIDITNGLHVPTTSSENSATKNRREYYDDLTKLLDIDLKRDCHIRQQGNTISIQEEADARVIPPDAVATEKDVGIETRGADFAAIVTEATSATSPKNSKKNAAETGDCDDSTLKCKDLDDKTISSATESCFNDKTINSKDTHQIFKSLATIICDDKKAVESKKSKQTTISPASGTCHKNNKLSLQRGNQSTMSATKKCKNGQLDLRNSELRTESVAENCESVDKFNLQESDYKTISSAIKKSKNDQLDLRNSEMRMESVAENCESVDIFSLQEHKTISSVTKTRNDDQLNLRNSELRTESVAENCESVDKFNLQESDHKTISSATKKCKNDQSDLRNSELRTESVTEKCEIANLSNLRESDRKTISATNKCNDDELDLRNSELRTESVTEKCEIADKSNLRESDRKTISATKKCNNDELNLRNSELRTESITEKCQIVDKSKLQESEQKAISAAAEMCNKDDNTNLQDFKDIHNEAPPKFVDSTEKIEKLVVKEELPNAEELGLKMELPEVEEPMVIKEEEPSAVDEISGAKNATEIEEPKIATPAAIAEEKTVPPKSTPQFRLLHHSELGSRWCPTPIAAPATEIAQSQPPAPPIPGIPLYLQVMPNTSHSYAENASRFMHPTNAAPVMIPQTRPPPPDYFASQGKNISAKASSPAQNQLPVAPKNVPVDKFTPNPTYTSLFVSLMDLHRSVDEYLLSPNDYDPAGVRHYFSSLKQILFDKLKKCCDLLNASEVINFIKYIVRCHDASLELGDIILEKFMHLAKHKDFPLQIYPQMLSARVAAPAYYAPAADANVAASKRQQIPQNSAPIAQNVQRRSAASLPQITWQAASPKVKSLFSPKALHIFNLQILEYIRLSISLQMQLTSMYKSHQAELRRAREQQKEISVQDILKKRTQNRGVENVTKEQPEPRRSPLAQQEFVASQKKTSYENSTFVPSPMTQQMLPQPVCGSYWKSLPGMAQNTNARKERRPSPTVAQKSPAQDPKLRVSPANIPVSIQSINSQDPKLCGSSRIDQTQMEAQLETRKSPSASSQLIRMKEIIERVNRKNQTATVDNQLRRSPADSGQKLTATARSSPARSTPEQDADARYEGVINDVIRSYRDNRTCCDAQLELRHDSVAPNQQSVHQEQIRHNQRNFAAPNQPSLHQIPIRPNQRNIAVSDAQLEPRQHFAAPIQQNLPQERIRNDLRIVAVSDAQFQMRRHFAVPIQQIQPNDSISNNQRKIAVSDANPETRRSPAAPIQQSVPQEGIGKNHGKTSASDPQLELRQSPAQFRTTAQEGNHRNISASINSIKNSAAPIRDIMANGTLPVLFHNSKNNVKPTNNGNVEELEAQLELRHPAEIYEETASGNLKMSAVSSRNVCNLRFRDVLEEFDALPTINCEERSSVSRSSATLPQIESLPVATPQIESLPVATPQIESLPVATPEIKKLPVATPQIESLPVATPQIESLPVVTPQIESLPVAMPQIESLPVAMPQIESLPVAKPQIESLPVAKPQIESLPVAKPQIESLPVAKPQIESLPVAMPQIESLPVSISQDAPILVALLQIESLPVALPQTESLPVEISQTESLPVEISQTESLPVKISQIESLSVESPQTESLPVDLPQTESLPVESPQTELLPPAETIISTVSIATDDKNKTETEESDEENDNYTLRQSDVESDASAASPVPVITINDDDDEDFDVRSTNGLETSEGTKAAETERKTKEETSLETPPEVREEGVEIVDSSGEIAKPAEEIDDEIGIFGILDVKSISKDVFNNMGEGSEIEAAGPSTTEEPIEILDIKEDTLPDCSRCGKSSSVVCEQCFSAFYCSARCHRTHWAETHHLSCKPVPEEALARL